MAARCASIAPVTVTKPLLFMPVVRGKSASATCAISINLKLSIYNEGRTIKTVISALSPDDAYGVESLSNSHEHQVQNRVKLIKTKVAQQLMKCGQSESLIIIDSIQRLGIEHIFKTEISAILERHYANWSTAAWESHDLYEDALRFRLLRQGGYHVPSDIFRKFKEKNGEFKVVNRKDIKGLMSLFEASQLSIPGEYLLDDVGEYSRQLLMNSLKDVKQSQARVIKNMLKNPLHKSLTRIKAQYIIQNFKTTLRFVHVVTDDKDWIKYLQELVMIDFQMAQVTHQNEISRISRWWKDLQLNKNMKLARDQPVKWHTWFVIAFPDLNMTEERIELTKAISLIYIIDDLFDLCGTLEELTAFTEAINKWDYTGIEGLPEYMKPCLKALYTVTSEFSHITRLKHGWEPEDTLRKAWADMCNAFLVESRWFASGHLPSSEEYLKNGIVSCAVHIVFVYAFWLLGEGINYETINLISKHPNIFTLVATILRLWDDLGSAKDEDQEGHDGSFIKCYMNDHRQISEEMARNIVRQRISNAWKKLNEESLSPYPLSADLAAACLNMARMIEIMYNYDDNHDLPTLDKYMKSLVTSI